MIPDNQEPSVLDYVRSAFRDWKSFTAFLRALTGLGSAAPLPVVTRQPERAAASCVESRPLTLPWRSLIALVCALIGQRTFEPPHFQGATLGVVFYLIALGWLCWAWLRGEWTLAPWRPAEAQEDEALTLSREAARLLGLGLFAAILAFLDFGDNRFTWHNLLLWGLAILLVFVSLWQRRQNQPSVWTRLRTAFQDKRGYAAALVAVGVAAVALFFRLYRLNEVPAEPFSDHAEKILDLYDITQGEYRVFFPRNTGREGFQMYWTVLVAKIFGTGLTFFSLKLGTAFLGLLTLPYLYLVGKEIANERVGVLAVLFAAIAYWPNVIARVGLRFPLYPLFTAPVLYYLLRGLRTQNRNDFLLAGLFLGLGLHGYSPFRIVPFLVVLAIGLYLLHTQARGRRGPAIIGLFLLALVAFFIFLPLLRYQFSEPQNFYERMFTRMGALEQPLPGPAWKIFLSNLWRGLKMFNWDNGEIWVNCVPYRPSLDVVSGALFLLGVALVLFRYLRQRHWLDLFLLLSIPTLSLPSILSLAFPNENPAPNRAGAAMIPVFLLVALALDGLLAALGARRTPETTAPAPGAAPARRAGWAWALAMFLFLWSATQNFDLVFHQYDRQYRLSALNTSEMGAVIRWFGKKYGTLEPVWIVPYPYWVDTRLPTTFLGIPNRDIAIWRDQLESTLTMPPPKLFIFKPDDTETWQALQSLYPQGKLNVYPSATEGHDFMFFIVE
jgi:hypothetical protein